MMTPEEARLKGIADLLSGNNQSSVWIEKNSKGDNWGVKIYHENPHKALEIMEEIYQKIKERHT